MSSARSRRPLSITTPRSLAFPACSRHAATTTLPKGLMPPAAPVPAFSNSRGASAAPAQPKSWLCRYWQTSRRARSSGLRQPSCTRRTSTFPKTRSCSSKVSTTTSARSSSMRRSTTMSGHERKIEIAVDSHRIDGTLVMPGFLVPGVLFVHGWGGSQQQYLARAHAVAALGSVCLTFDLGGHAGTQPLRETVSRESNLRDVVAAYDTLAAHPLVDRSVIAVAGSSYGG